MASASDYRIELFPLDRILPTEEYSPRHTEHLRTEIEITGIWTHPLLVDTRKFALMDGHHRYHAARELGLKTVPVILLDYDDPMVVLKAWEPGKTFTREDIWAICESGALLPMKSTRHVIHAQLPFSRVPLDRLRQPGREGEPVTPAQPHPSRVQILSDDYHALGARMAMRTASGAKLDLETAETLVPHSHLRQVLQGDPAMAALLSAASCRIALGRQTDFPFRLVNDTLLLLPPSLLASSAAMSAAARWGLEAAFARQAGVPGRQRLAALVRHGAALVRRLPMADRAMLLDPTPGGISAELTGSRLDPPSPALVAWIAGKIGVDADQLPADETMAPLSLEAPIEALLVSGGDSRLSLDRQSGKNKYGTTPRPRPEAVHFSSSTASSISDYGFLYCDVLRRDLLAHVRENALDPREARAALSDALIAELRDMCGLDTHEADGAIAASGTDTELLAVLMARAAAPGAELFNLLISPEETGRGVKLAGAGLYFDPLSATGAPIAMGQPVWPGVTIGVADIAIRNASGEKRPIEALDAEFLETGRQALDRGQRVLAHVLIGSKTGLSGPSDAAVDALVAMAPDRVDVVVDACQMRVDYAYLGECVRRGWMVQVSGSKSLTGPPFSGALLVPTAMRDRVDAAAALLEPGIGYPEDWSAAWAPRMGRSAAVPSFGAPFRWLPALLEAKLLRHVPDAMRVHALDRFRAEATERLTHSACLRILSREIGDDNAPHAQQFLRHSIISFQVFGREWDGGLTPLDEPSCRRIFELLNRDAQPFLPDATRAEKALLGQEFHIGQPVALGKGADARAVLRLVIGMRFFTIIGHAGPGGISVALESEISDLVRAIDKLDILVENWWRLRDDL